MTSRARTIGAVIIWCLLCSSCRPIWHSGEVFTPFGDGGSWKLQMRNHEILDLGVSQLHNKSDDPIRITGVKLVDIPAAVHQGRVDAFTYEQTHSGVYSELGDLTKRCPKLFVPLHRPYPVIKPRSDATYYLTVQVRIQRPGKYRVDSAQVSYVDLKTHESGAQVMDLYTVVRVVRGPATVFPRSVCNS